MEEKGSKQVTLFGENDKREITALLAISRSGVLLPPQIIYAGKTERCHPRVDFPPRWDVTHTESHWSNSDSMVRYVEKILSPYFEKARKRLGLEDTHKGLCVYDVYRAHRTDEFRRKLDCSNLIGIQVPPNTTSELQPLDVGFNKPYKTALSTKFSEWYAGQINEQLMNGIGANSVKIKLDLSVMKPIHAVWLIQVHEEMSRKNTLIKKCFHKVGIPALESNGYDSDADTVILADSEPDIVILTDDEPDIEVSRISQVSFSDVCVTMKVKVPYEFSTSCHYYTL